MKPIQTIYICNTDFEFELTENEKLESIEQTWSRSPICLQLQYLPLLYANATEAIAVTQKPNDSFLKSILTLGIWQEKDLPTFIELKDHQRLQTIEKCDSWGASKRVQQWADSHSIKYIIPKFQLVKEINSKQFSFQLMHVFNQSALIWNEQELKNWLSETSGKRVLKTCFGVSGRGHHFISSETMDISSILSFCQREWNVRQPLIAEPWVDRVFDFSTQWYLDSSKGIQCVGSTVFKSNAKGAYEATITGPETDVFSDYLPFLEEHKRIVLPHLEMILRKGYFGYLGIDAFIYQDAQSQLYLHPLVEINARQTMSLAALRFQQRWFPTRILRLEFAKQSMNDISLLPPTIMAKEKTIAFNRSLVFSIL